MHRCFRMTATKRDLFIAVQGILFLLSAKTVIGQLTATTSTSESSEPEYLTMCYLIERNTTGMIYDYNKAAVALDLAMDYSNDYVLPAGIKLKSVYRNIGRRCQAKGHVVAHAVDLRMHGIKCNVFIGPGCGLSAERLHDLADYWNLPIIGCPAAGLGLSAPASSYSMASRVSITYTTITDVIIRFFNDFNYTTPAVFQDEAVNFFEQMGELMQKTMNRRSKTFEYGTRYFGFSSTLSTNEKVQALLTKASQSSRVFILLADAAVVRNIMINAHTLGMTTGSYVFLAVELYPSDTWGKFTWAKNDDSDPIAREAFKALLILSLKEMTDDSLFDFWNQVVKMSKEIYGFEFSPFEKNTVDPVVSHFYDAVLLYSNVVTLLQKQGLDYTSGTDFTSAVAGYSFQSPLTGIVAFNADSDRTLSYVLRALHQRTGKHENLFGYSATSNLTAPLGTLEWFGGTSLPPNTPACGFFGENPVCAAQRNLSSGSMAAVVCVLIIPIGIGLSAYYGIKKVVQAQADPFFWRIFVHDLTISGRNRISKSTDAADRTELFQISDGKGSEVLSRFDTKVAENSDEVSGESLTAVYGGTTVSLYPCNEPKQRVPPSLTSEAFQIRKMMHPNVLKFIGVAISEENLCFYFVAELCQRGSLHALIDDDSLNLDWEFKNSLIKDLATGMHFLHASSLNSHGQLSDKSCQIDSRFILKISHYMCCLRNLNDMAPVTSVQERDFHGLLWQAPEFLRRQMPVKGTQKGDVYSYAILLQQIVLRSDPFQIRHRIHDARKTSMLNAKDIVLEVKRGLVPLLRPPVPMSACSTELHDLMDSCWEEDPAARPSFTKIRAIVRNAIGKSGDNIVDHLIRRMEQYSISLEHEAEAKTRQFMEERQRSADLLQVILPRTIAEALLRGESLPPENFEATTVYFGCIPGFKELLSTVKSPMDVVSTLNNLYVTCDEIIARHDVFKVETVIDSYVVVSGLPIPNGTAHIEQIATMALMLRKAISMLATNKGSSFKLRAGIHSGPCVAGVIGHKMPRYCLFGDTVNTASRMESHGEAGKIHCSQASKLALDSYEEFFVAERGLVDIKGKGPMSTYWLMGKY